MAETTGCQLWGIMGRFLTDNEITDQELDAIKRRLFAYQDINDAHNITLYDIQELKSREEIRNMINEYTPIEIGKLFA